MREKDVMEIIQDREPAFCSRLFLAEKTLGRWRPVTDMPPLNTFVMFSKFKMVTIALALASIRRGNIMFSMEVKDAGGLYFSFCASSHDIFSLRETRTIFLTEYRERHSKKTDHCGGSTSHHNQIM